jgi:hypothetical protein
MAGSAMLNPEFVWGARAYSDISGVPQWSTVKIGNVVYLDLIRLYPGFDITSSHQTEVTVLYMWAELKSGYKYRFSCFF